MNYDSLIKEKHVLINPGELHYWQFLLFFFFFYKFLVSKKLKTCFGIWSRASSLAVPSYLFLFLFYKCLLSKKEKYVLINRVELHYWQFLNPIGEEISSQLLSSFTSCYQNPISRAHNKKLKNRYERK